MLKNGVLIFAIAIGCQSVARGQADTSRTDSMRSAHPDEWYHQQLPTDPGPAKDSVQVDQSQLPRALAAALARDDHYEGWERGEIYLNRNTSVYQVHIIRDSILYVYGLRKNGKPVSLRTQRIPIPPKE